MTAPARHDHPPVTDGVNARVRVRAAGNPRVVPIRPDTDRPIAYTRAISRSPDQINTDKPGKIRNFASQHAGEAKSSLTSSWLGQERPQNLAKVAEHVTRNPATWFRVTVYAIAYLACFAVDTNKRAAVTFTLLTLSILTAWATSAYAH